MTLPVILYNLDSDTMRRLLDLLGELSVEAGVPFWVSMSTTGVTETLRAIEDVGGISLIVLGVDGPKEDPERLAIRLGHMALRRNRDHYVVYIVKHRELLEQTAALCVRASGMLTAPVLDQAVKHVFGEILKDYARLFENEPQEESAWLHLKTHGAIVRVRMEDICMAQAVSKRVQVHTLRDVITVTDSLESLERQLGDTFFRCHRSYLINSRRVAYIDFKDMTIRLQDNSSVPLARSFKQSMHEYMEEKRPEQRA